MHSTNKSLECCWCSTKSKWHNTELSGIVKVVLCRSSLSHWDSVLEHAFQFFLHCCSVSMGKSIRLLSNWFPIACSDVEVGYGCPTRSASQYLIKSVKFSQLILLLPGQLFSYIVGVVLRSIQEYLVFSIFIFMGFFIEVAGGIRRIPFLQHIDVEDLFPPGMSIYFTNLAQHSIW